MEPEGGKTTKTHKDKEEKLGREREKESEREREKQKEKREIDPAVLVGHRKTRRIKRCSAFQKNYNVLVSRSNMDYSTRLNRFTETETDPPEG